MAEHAIPGDRVAKYSGKPLSAEEASETNSAYKFQVHKNLILDVQGVDEFSGRYVNDGPKAGKTVNARFGSKRTTSACPVTGKQWVSIFATKPLRPGDEILVDYGTSYQWNDRADRS